MFCGRISSSRFQEIFKFEECVKYANKYTAVDVMYSKEYVPKGKTHARAPTTTPAHRGFVAPLCNLGNLKCKR